MSAPLESMPETIANLRREVERLQRVNDALATQVEEHTGSQDSAFAMFQTAIVLEKQVLARTQELGQTLAQLRAVNRDLERARVEADAGSRAKSEFLAMMSHEIRTPLNGVIGLAELLRGSALDGDQRTFVEGILRSAEVLLSILNDVLDLSKIEAGRMDLDPTDFALRQLLDGIRTLYSGTCAQKGLALVLDVHGDVPEWIRADAMRLRQVLLNLVGNAIKFTSRGTIRVQVRCDAAGSRLQFAVSDEGIGISQEQRARLFQPFTQADPSMSRRYGGTGLGLTICSRLCRLMGGELDVESEPGRGSTFSFAIVVAPATAIETPSSEPALPTFAARVLVADDNRINQLVTRSLLERLGCTVEVVGNGIEAVEAAAQRRFDIVLMDMQMPELDGLAATRELRNRRATATLPIVALTANALAGDAQRCLEAGMDAHLSKPVRSRELAACLGKFLPAPLHGNPRTE